MAKENINKPNKHAEKLVKRTLNKQKRHKLHTGSTNRLVQNKDEAKEIALSKVRDKGEIVSAMTREKTQPGKSMKTKSNKHKRKHDDKW